jgi:hypothetical protein
MFLHSQQYGINASSATTMQARNECSCISNNMEEGELTQVDEATRIHNTAHHILSFCFFNYDRLNRASKHLDL